MRALLIDPHTRSVEPIEMFQTIADIEGAIGGTAKRYHRLPNRSQLFAVDGVENRPTFSIGGSIPIAGKALIVGMRGRFGLYRDTRVDECEVKKLIRFFGL
jgi:hypothetical protein